MSWRYKNFTVEPEKSSLHLRFDLEGTPNDARDLQLGAQFLDPANDTFLREGPHVPFPHAPPATPVPFALNLPLRNLPQGHSRMIVSPLETGKGWHYLLGKPYLRLDLRVDEGQIEVLRSAVSSRFREALPRFLRGRGRAFTYPVKTTVENWPLIQSMVRRDILGRYRGSFAGIFWSILNPLLLMITYYFVFGIVLQARFGEDPSRSGFVLYFLAGMLPWLPFSEAVGRSPMVLIEHSNIIKKLIFPIGTLPVNLVMAGLVTQFFAVAVFLIGLVVMRGSVPWTAVFVPLLILPQVLLTMGLSWFFAALGVFFRDLGQVMGFLLTLWFFLTPICYPEASLPASAVPVLSQNPIYQLVGGFRDVLLVGKLPEAQPYLQLCLVSGFAFVAGHAFFYKVRRNFADLL
jgi:lipopolysaccharide transport system permease protein